MKWEELYFGYKERSELKREDVVCAVSIVSTTNNVGEMVHFSIVIAK